MIWTEEKTWKTESPSNSSFIWDRYGFINNPHRGLDYVKSAIVPHLGGGDIVVNGEVFYQKKKEFEEFNGSSVLLIGGGPSLNSFDFSTVGDYDKVVSCNHYFVNEYAAKIPMSFVFLGDEVKPQDPRLVAHLENTSHLIGFENIGRSQNELSLFKEKYGDRIFWAHTRYHSKIGAMVRIASFVCSLKPKSISIIGMDGYKHLENDKDENHHGFQKDKKKDGTYERNFTGVKLEQKYKNQYLEFWDYVLHDIGKDIEFYNLGHGHACNLSTEVLTEKIGENYRLYLSDPHRRV